MTARIKPGEAAQARVDYTRTSAARNRARQRECVDGSEFTVAELVAERDRLKAECRLRHPEWFR